jgi:hypothetical protein
LVFPYAAVEKEILQPVGRRLSSVTAPTSYCIILVSEPI